MSERLLDRRSERSHRARRGRRRASILVIEDDESIVGTMTRGLDKAGFDVRAVAEASAARQVVLDHTFDLIVLDVTLPDGSGLDLLRAWQGTLDVPVIVLTARTGLDERLDAFRFGACDFVPKPFWVEELVARIRTRLAAADDEIRRVAWAGVSIDLDARTVTVGSEPIAFTRHELDILLYLAARPGRAVTRAQLADEALPLLGERGDRTVDSHIARIRKKLGETASARLATVWGIGYRFERIEENE